MSGYLWTVVGYLILAMVVSPIGIGRQRRPLEGGTVAVIMALQLGLLFCVLKGGGVL